MATSRIQNTKRNIIWGLIQKILAILLPFCTRTALIYQLGVNYVGLYSFYASVLGMLNLVELGFGVAIAYSMYEPIAKEDHATVGRLLVYFKRVYRVIGIVILCLGLIVMPFLGNLITGEQPADVNIQIGFLIYLLNTVISYLLFGYRQTLITAHQRADVLSKVQGIVLISLNLAQVLMLIVWPNFYVYLILLPLTTIIQNIILFCASNRLFPQYKELGYLKSGLTKEESKAIRQRVVGVFLYRSCAATRDSCDAIFISMFIGLSIAGCYSNYYLLVNSVCLLLQVACSSLTAPVGNSIVTESKEKNFRDMRLFMFLYASVAVVFLACVLCLFQPFMELWVGKDLMLPDEIVWLLCAYFYMRVLGDIRSVYIDATGLWWKLKGRSIIEAVLNLVLNYVLIQVIGLPGIVLGTLISMFLINYLWGSEVIFSNYFKNGGLTVFFKDNLLYILATLVCIMTPYLILQSLPFDPLLKLIVGMFIAVFLSAGIWVLLFFRSKRFKAAINFIKVIRG